MYKLHNLLKTTSIITGPTLLEVRSHNTQLQHGFRHDILLLAFYIDHETIETCFQLILSF